jgi:hypothetical protein
VTNNATVTGTVTAGAFSGPLTGNVTGNVSGSSGSCTGNAASATTASALTTTNNYQVNSLGVGVAASGTAGNVKATTGTFSGAVTATGVAVGGALTTATTGSFTGAVSAVGVTSTGGVAVGGALTTATTGSFSGAVSTGALTVNGNIFVGPGYQQFMLPGGNSYGYMYGAYATLGDGVHIGYNFYNNNTANFIPNAGGSTSRMTFGFGTIGCYTGAINTAPTNLGYYQDKTGDVGIGTTAPSVKLDVNGTVKSSGGFMTGSLLLSTSATVVTLYTPGCYRFTAISTQANRRGYNFTSLYFFFNGYAVVDDSNRSGTPALGVSGVTNAGLPTANMTVNMVLAGSEIPVWIKWTLLNSY